jgi:hypothetical protein
MTFFSDIGFNGSTLRTEAARTFALGPKGMNQPVDRRDGAGRERATETLMQVALPV